MTLPTAGHTYVLNQKLMSLSGDLWIEDEQGNNAFQVDGKAFSLRRTLILEDASGNPLYAINKSLAHLHRTFEIKQGRHGRGHDPGGARQLPGRPFHDHPAPRRRAQRQGRLDRPRVPDQPGRHRRDRRLPQAAGGPATATGSRSPPTSRRRWPWRSSSPSSRWSSRSARGTTPAPARSAACCRGSDPASGLARPGNDEAAGGAGGFLRQL